MAEPSPPLPQRLTRDTRDSLFLLALIAAVIAPHLGHLPWWAGAIAGLVIAWRGWLSWRQRPLPGRWLLLAVLALYSSLTWLNFRTLLGREAGITLLVVLLALKTLELRARRDAYVVFFLGFFLVLAQFLYSQSLLVGLWMLGAVWGLLAALVLAQMPGPSASLRVAATHAARTTALGLPVMVALFLLFPRIAPLWGVPSEAVGRTGLSNQLDFGAMSEIANDDGIAMRLRFLDGSAPPPPEQRYFRGPVLTRFDGKTWRAPSPAQNWLRGQDRLQLPGPALRYELTLEPLRIPVLPLLEMSPGAVGSPLSLPDLTLTRSPELQWSAPRPITERLRLTAEAHPRWQAGMERRGVQLAAELELPPGLNPRTLAWAQALASQPRFRALEPAEHVEALVQAVLQHIRSADFTYTLAPGRYGEDSPHVIDEFWLDRRLGFCEHFASAFVVVLRAMGIPARLVTGFQGWDAEPQDGYYVVRNAQAHAWVEYWTPGQGWRRADPTAAVAPNRVVQGQALRPAPGVIGQLNPTLWRTLRGAWETLDNRWAQWVLNYSRQNQFDLLKGLGVAHPDWATLGQALAGVILVAALAGAAWLRWQARPRDAWSRLRAELLAELQRLGLPAQAHQGPAHWAGLAERQFGPRAATLAGLLETLELQRYGRAADPARPAIVRHLRGPLLRACRQLRPGG